MRTGLQRYQEAAALCRYVSYHQSGTQLKRPFNASHSNPNFLILSSHFWISPKPKPPVIIEIDHPFHPPSFGSPFLSNSLPSYHLHLHGFRLQQPPYLREFSLIPNLSVLPLVPHHEHLNPESLPTPSGQHCPMLALWGIIAAPSLTLIFPTTLRSHKMQLNLSLCKGNHLFFGLPVCHSFQVFSIVGTGCT